MDKELEQLLEQLKEVANETQSQSQPQTQTQEYVSSQSQNYANDVEAQFKVWKDIGIMRFTSKYQHLPKFYQILNLIVPRADRKVLEDIQANKVKDDYLIYLENAYKEVVKEVASFSKDILSTQTQVNRTSNTNQKQMPDYTMDKYYNDYKKYLEDITVKDVALIEFRDGIEDNGKIRSIGIPKATLEERLKISEN
jgi:hypothetical protein